VRWRALLASWLPVLGLIAACGGAPEPSGPPNIVLVIGDDHGWPDSGFMGSEIAHTPHLDALAREGFVLTHGFTTASSCRPSLLSLLTGLHPAQVSARLGRPVSSLLLGSPVAIRQLDSLPGLLAREGYVSFEGGKFWDGSFADAGFQEGTTDWRKPALGRETMQPLWDFLEAHRDQPFFVWFAPMLPHLPFDAPEEFRAPYRESGLTGRPLGYLANVTRLDARIGELVERLEALGLRERTLVVYLSDNGWEWNSAEAPARNALFGGPHGKMTMYELGFRTPLVLSWPGVLPPGRDDRLVSAVDVLPTLLDFAGAPLPPGLPGRSLRPLLLGTGGFERDQVAGGMTLLRPAGPAGNYRSRGETGWFLRTPQWRYIWYPERDREELYRIAEDPFETVDLAAEHPEEVARLRKRMQRWIARAKAPPRIERWLSRRREGPEPAF
jgi:arylsulfatase A